MPAEYSVDPKSPPAPLLDGDAVQPVPDGDGLLCEHSGWAIYTLKSGEHSPLEANCLTHVGCEVEFPNWHLAVYIWSDYRPEGDARFVCRECAEIMPSEAYAMFCKVHKLLNMK